MTCKITPDQYAAIGAHGAETFPYECCGILIGRADGDDRIVVELRPLANANNERPRDRFLITPEDFMQGDAYARKRGLDIVGFYHSHPDSPARPSQFDLEHAWPWYSYIIVSVRNGQPQEMYSWRQRDDRSAFDQEELAVEEHQSAAPGEAGNVVQ